MNGKQLTKWFDGKKFVPGRVGVYQIQHTHDAFKYWDGNKWCWAASTPESAAKN